MTNFLVQTCSNNVCYTDFTQVYWFLGTIIILLILILTKRK